MDKIPAFGLTLQPPNPPSPSALALLSDTTALEADGDIVSLNTTGIIFITKWRECAWKRREYAWIKRNVPG